MKQIGIVSVIVLLGLGVLFLTGCGQQSVMQNQMLPVSPSLPPQSPPPLLPLPADHGDKSAVEDIASGVAKGVGKVTEKFFGDMGDLLGLGEIQ